MYIDGEWVDAANGKLEKIINPANEEPIDTIPLATAEDLDKALAAAERAWKSWREIDVWTRSRHLRKIAFLIRERVSQIARILTEEQGKVLAEAEAEVNATADQFDWYADECRRIYGRTLDGHSRAQRLMVIRQPIGPVAAFSPWNFPILLPGRKIAPALAAGCSIIVKPAIEAPRACLSLAQACHDAGIPPGVVNMVTGKSSFISEYLVRSPVIRKVTLTGSVPVGQEIMRLCANYIKPSTMELGGHSPVLIFKDADIEKAAEITARAKFRNNGQVCIAASRFYVHESVAEQYIKRFTEISQSLRLGNGMNKNTDLGPLANKRRLETTEELIQDALDKGALLKTGGKRSAKFKKGFFFEPTVITNINDNMRIIQEEPFCPVAPITRFSNLKEVLAMANASSFGLAGYLFTNNLKTMYEAAEGLEVGMIGVNNLVIAAAEMPFGGIKYSGIGREGGAEGIASYTVTKFINIQL